MIFEQEVDEGDFSVHEAGIFGVSVVFDADFYDTMFDVSDTDGPGGSDGADGK